MTRTSTGFLESEPEIFVQVTNFIEVRSSYIANLGTYEIIFVVGLKTESMAELITRTPIQTFNLIVINDVCTSILEPVVLLPEYIFNTIDPSSLLVIELDAESGDCNYNIIAIGFDPSFVGTLVNQATFINHIEHHDNMWQKDLSKPLANMVIDSSIENGTYSVIIYYLDSFSTTVTQEITLVVIKAC